MPLPSQLIDAQGNTAQVFGIGANQNLAVSTAAPVASSALAATTYAVRVVSTVPVYIKIGVGAIAATTDMLVPSNWETFIKIPNPASGQVVSVLAQAGTGVTSINEIQ